MNRRLVRNIGIVLCIFVILFGGATLFVYLGGYTDKVLGIFSAKETEIPTEETTVVSQPVEAQPLRPSAKVEAVWLREGDDAFTADAPSAAAKIADWGFNSVIIEGSDDFVKAVADEAQKLGIYSFRHLGTSSLFSSANGALAVDAEKCASALSSGAQSLLLSQDMSISSEGSSLRLALSSLKEQLLKIQPDLWLGVMTVREDKKDYTVFSCLDLFDYEYVDLLLPTRSKNANFVDFVNSKASAGAEIIFGHRNDKLLSDGLWSEPDEIILQLSITDTLTHGGNAFFSYKSLDENKKNTADALFEYLSTRVLQDFFKELTFTKPAKTTYTTENSSVAFVGSGDKKYAVTMNGKKVTMTDEGYFSFDQKLSAGKNTLVFEHKDKKVTYNITYKVKLLKSVSPMGAVSAPGNSTLEVTAVAHKSASVTATLAGKTVKLYPSDYSDDDNANNIGTDYSYFFGSITLPAEKTLSQKLGSFTIKASYNGLSESMTGASVTVNRKKTEVTVPPTTVPPTTQAPTAPQTPSTDEFGSDVTDEFGSTSQTPTTEAPTTEKLPVRTHCTPYSYNGVAGKSQMIEVAVAYAESLPASTINDVSVPYSSPLLRGTVDYVENEASYGSIKYYVLASGRRVYQSNVKFIASGYNMPANDIKVAGVSSKSNSSDILLSMAWKVPINTRIFPQNYVTYTAGRPYSVNSVTATYIDIVFYHTTAHSGKVTMPSGSVIKSAEWLSNASGQTVTLRLHFRKAGGFYGMKMSYDNDGILRLSVKERHSTSLSGKVIMLDPGHGGKDPGALGAIYAGSARLYESNVNLALALKIKSRLESQGATVLMTRTTQSAFLELDERRDMCRSKNPDIFIAVHCDAAENSASASGTSAFYYKEYSQPLAKAVHSSIVNAYKTKIYADNSAMAAKADRVMQFGAYRVTRLEECPAILVEYGFVTNVTEAKKLTNESCRETLADATVSGIANYFKNS